jgi:ubiquinone/menaquinone biosynthesis C-methylase UbiE
VDRLLDATRLAEERHFWFRGFRRFVAPLLAEAAAGRQNLSLLDCGCGTGANLAVLEPYGRAIGIDLTMRGLELGRRYGRRLLARATVTRLPFPDRLFDVVTSFDVIYSLTDEDEAAALAEMARVLVPGGALVLNVAAMPVLRGDHSVLALERRRYTRGLLRDRLVRAGLRVERLTHTNASLFPVMLAVRLAQRMRGLATHEDEATGEITVPPAPVNGALAALLAVEARLVRHVQMPFGSSLLCLARKPL